MENRSVCHGEAWEGELEISTIAQQIAQFTPYFMHFLAETDRKGEQMYIRGKNIEFARVLEIIDTVSNEKYAGNIKMHADAGPIRETSYEWEDFTTEWGHTYKRKVNVRGYGFKGRIIGAVTDDPGTRRSASGRRGRQACWHAYRDVLRAVFAEYPHAVVTTAMARYEGSDGFERVYPGTGNANVGSHAFPAFMPDLCDCDDSE